MKIPIYIVAMVLFVGGILLMGYAFELTEGMAIMFFGGILAVSLSIAIPFHLLGKQPH